MVLTGEGVGDWKWVTKILSAQSLYLVLQNAFQWLVCGSVNALFWVHIRVCLGDHLELWKKKKKKRGLKWNSQTP